MIWEYTGVNDNDTWIDPCCPRPISTPEPIQKSPEKPRIQRKSSAEQLAEIRVKRKAQEHKFDQLTKPWHNTHEAYLLWHLERYHHQPPMHKDPFTDTSIMMFTNRYVAASQRHGEDDSNIEIDLPTEKREKYQQFCEDYGVTQLTRDLISGQITSLDLDSSKIVENTPKRSFDEAFDEDSNNYFDYFELSDNY
jgi:hypothetical protein